MKLCSKLTASILAVGLMTFTLPLKAMASQGGGTPPATQYCKMCAVVYNTFHCKPKTKNCGGVTVIGIEGGGSKTLPPIEVPYQYYASKSTGNKQTIWGIGATPADALADCKRMQEVFKTSLSQEPPVECKGFNKSPPYGSDCKAPDSGGPAKVATSSPEYSQSPAKQCAQLPPGAYKGPGGSSGTGSQGSGSGMLSGDDNNEIDLGL